MSNMFSFFSSFINSLFGGGSDIESVKRRALRIIARNYENSRYRKFINLRKQELTVDFANFIYQFYEANGNMALLFTSQNFSAIENQLRILCNVALMPDEMKKIYYSFDDDSIQERVNEKGINATVEEIKVLFNQIKSFYTKDVVTHVNLTYRNLMAIINYIKFDYFDVLKKFDKLMPEGDFNYKPKFLPVYSPKVSENLKDFHQILLDIDFNYLNLGEIISVINLARSTSLTEKNFLKVFKNLKDFAQMNIIQDMICLIDEEPTYTLRPKPHVENVAQFFMEKVGKDLQQILYGLQEKKRKEVANTVAKNIFDKFPAQKLTNYCDRLNDMILENAERGFQYSQIMNFLKSFIDEVYERNIKDILDHYILKAKWKSQSVEKAISEYFHTVKVINQNIVDFDASLAESQKLGASIRAYARSADKTSGLMIKRLLKEVDDDALGILNQAGHNFLKMGKALKYLLDDPKDSSSKIVSNWQEIEKEYKNDDLIIETENAFEKIENFVGLMQQYFK